MLLRKVVIFLIVFLNLSFVYAQERLIAIPPENKIQIWTESFGKPSNPSVLLIIGAGAQSLLWPDEFCQKLAAEGFYVIRYDHRDTGLSSAINYQQQPYSVMDLTKDALAVLDGYHLEKAHVVGFSMGGEIVQFIGAYFPERALSLTLMATSTTMKPGFDAFEGNYKPGDLSPPTPEYVKWATRQVIPEQTLEQKIEDFVHSWRLLSGGNLSFDENLYRNIAKQCFGRTKLHNPYQNHAKAMKASFEQHEKAPLLIKTKTLIVHGTADPIFGLDHAEALKTAIPHSKLALIKDWSHSLNPVFYQEVISLLSKHMKGES